METATQHILDELKAIRSDLHYLKEHVKDVDLVLTDEDVESIKRARTEFKAGKTKRLI